MIKNKLVLLFLFVTLFNCKNEDVFVEYHGELVKVDFRVGKTDSLFNGFGGEAYNNGKIKRLAYYKNGEIFDTLFTYHRNGSIQSKGLLEGNLKKGWWSYYDNENVLINKNEYVILDSINHINQSLFYDNSKLKVAESSFFEILIPDTLILGRNAGRLKKYENRLKPNDTSLLSVILVNQKLNSEIRVDTFPAMTRTPYFGISIYNKGKQKIKGKILEKVLTKVKYTKDSFELVIKNNYKYFEKEVYVVDGDIRIKVGSDLWIGMMKDFEKY